LLVRPAVRGARTRGPPAACAAWGLCNSHAGSRSLKLLALAAPEAKASEAPAHGRSAAIGRRPAQQLPQVLVPARGMERPPAIRNTAAGVSEAWIDSLIAWLQRKRRSTEHRLSRVGRSAKGMQDAITQNSLPFNMRLSEAAKPACDFLDALTLMTLDATDVACIYVAANMLVRELDQDAAADPEHWLQVLATVLLLACSARELLEEEEEEGFPKQ